MPTLEKEKTVKTARIYKLVYEGQVRLVRARSAAKAIRFICAPITAVVASQDDIVDHLKESEIEDSTI